MDRASPGIEMQGKFGGSVDAKSLSSSFYIFLTPFLISNTSYLRAYVIHISEYIIVICRKSKIEKHKVDSVFSPHPSSILVAQLSFFWIKGDLLLKRKHYTQPLHIEDAHSRKKPNRSKRRITKAK